MKSKVLKTIGGTFSNTMGEAKASSVVVKLHNKLATILSEKLGYMVSYSYNGGSVIDLESAADKADGDLTIWMPNVSNNLDKIYPKKPKGGVLICSKVLRPNRTYYDAVGRIFKMHGNAVIAIQKTKGTMFKFTLLDALGNVWINTYSLEILAEAIYKFYKWSLGVKRVDSTFSDYTYNPGPKQFRALKRFCKVNKLVADKVEAADVGRYFGNCSTRCSLMFPSARALDEGIYVSKRNSNKKRLVMSDLLVTTLNSDNSVTYYGDKFVKPSVDTPIQLQLYRLFPEINYMIHGHAYIKDAPFTGTYYSCGDLREINDTAANMDLTKGASVLNLRNHGFLIYAKTIEALEKFVNKATFITKKIGAEFVN